MNQTVENKQAWAEKQTWKAKKTAKYRGPCLGPWPYCSQGLCPGLWFLLLLKAMRLPRVWMGTWGYVRVQDPYCWAHDGRLALAPEAMVTARPKLLLTAMSGSCCSWGLCWYPLPMLSHGYMWTMYWPMCWSTRAMLICSCPSLV